VNPGVPWTFKWLGTGDLEDESVNRKGTYKIYGDGGEFRMRYDVEGRPVKSFD